MKAEQTNKNNLDLDDMFEKLNSRLHKDVIIETRRYLHAVFEKVEVEGVLLYGSAAKGSYIPEISDIDLIVVVNVPMETYRSIKRQVIKETLSPVEALWFSPDELIGLFQGRIGMILDALYDGIILYDPNNLLTRLKEELNHLISKNKIKRLPWGGWQFPDVKFGKIVEI